ncbi:MAG: SLBB domain-containing protein [Vicinamibacteria bacterium]
MGLGLTSSPAVSQEYEIAAGDILTITVAGQPSMSGDHTVDREGMVVLNGLGLRVKASEMTPKAFERKLVTLLSDGYLKKPDVQINLKESRSDRVYVTGQVDKPGPYPLRGDRTLLTLIGDMGGLPKDAGHEVVVIRPPAPAATPAPTTTEDGEAPAPEATPTPSPDTSALPNAVPGSQVIRARTSELLSGNPEKNLALLAGDTVYFPRPANVYVTGEVSRPGPIRFEEGITVFQAITLAGGINSRGSDKVKVVRIVDGRQVKLGAKMTDLLLPEDTIVVSERFF